MKTWEYWETRFGDIFSDTFRKEVCRLYYFFRSDHDDFYHPPLSNKGNPLTRKETIRELERSKRSGVVSCASIAYFIESQTIGYSFGTLEEKIDSLIEKLKNNPKDFLMASEEPEPKYSQLFYHLFEDHGLSTSLGSIGTIYGKEGMNVDARNSDIPETPFLEFIRKLVFRGASSNAKLLASLHKSRQRKANEYTR